MTQKQLYRILFGPIMGPILYSFADFINKAFGKKIAILGMKGAGKTRLYKFLQGQPYSEEEDGQTTTERIAGFDYKKADGSIVHIKEGVDIGGGREYAMQMYEELIKENETIFFIFNLYEYATKEAVRKDVNGRLNFIAKQCKEGKKELYIFGSHPDMFNSKSIIKETIDEFKHYMAHGLRLEDSNRFAIVNLTDNDQVQELMDKVFS